MRFYRVFPRLTVDRGIVGFACAIEGTVEDAAVADAAAVPWGVAATTTVNRKLAILPLIATRVLPIISEISLMLTPLLMRSRSCLSSSIDQDLPLNSNPYQPTNPRLLAYFLLNR